MSTPKTSKSQSSPRPKAAFSPVAVAYSPVSKGAQKGNLTGLPRILQDLIKKFQASLGMWISHHKEGMDVISKMKSLNLFEGSKRNYKLDDELQVLCDLLAENVQELVLVVEMMTKLRNELEAITQLSEVKQNNYDSPENPLFLTWPISKFVETVDYILKSYQEELKVKQMVLKEIGLSQDSNELAFSENAWRYQPMLFPDEINFKIEAALLETGIVQ
ncbi:cyclin-dependent kinase 2-interacting protein-like [Cloeon dipterum]|uniref:cyclin-dependent kinase 2-interacting protein-like n=1 Tax=Cloeon dipterum TaxID=197152 RepID=UPI00321FFBC2